MPTILNVSYSVFKTAVDYFTVYYTDLPVGYFAGCGNSEIVYTTKVEDSADITDFDTNILPDAISVALEDDVIASPTLKYISKTTRYDITDTVIYTGIANQGTAENAVGWTITKTEFTAGDPTSKTQTKTESAIWDNRALETYY